MAAAPYYLLALGIALVVLGYLVAALMGGGGSSYIDPRMSDEEIARQMNKRGSPIGGIIMVLGAATMVASIVWRIARMIG